MDADSLRKNRLDMFAGEHISVRNTKMDKKKVLDTERAFIKFCEVECGWSSHEMHDLESMKNALREFVKKRPEVYQYVKIEN